MWVNVSSLRKQHDDKDWASNHRPSDLKFNALTTTPPHVPTYLVIPRALNEFVLFDVAILSITE